LRTAPQKVDILPKTVLCGRFLNGGMRAGIVPASFSTISVEIKPDMIGHYLAEFSITYKPIRHGRSGGKGDAYCPLR
jgi:hypothetical protein